MVEISFYFCVSCILILSVVAIKVYFVKDINAGSKTEEENTVDEVKTICAHVHFLFLIEMLLFQHPRQGIHTFASEYGKDLIHSKTLIFVEGAHC